MTEGTIDTKGTRILFGYVPPTSTDLSHIIHEVACPTGLNDLTAGEKPRQDITCLKSRARQYKPGLADPPALQIPINFIPRSEAHQALIEAKRRSSDLVMPWMVVMDDQPNDPVTVDSNGYLESPGPTSVGFKGYVANFSITAAVGTIWTGTVTVQLQFDDDDEDLHWDLPEADLP